jgi:hypothetical protein
MSAGKLFLVAILELPGTVLISCRATGSEHARNDPYTGQCRGPTRKCNS